MILVLSAGVPASIEVTWLRTMLISSWRSSTGITVSKLKRRLRALDISLTPRSRVLAVPMMLKPRRARTTPASPSSGTIITLSLMLESSVSWTSWGVRVISSKRTSIPSRMPM